MLNSALRKKTYSRNPKRKGIAGKIRLEKINSSQKSSLKIYAPRLLSGDLKVKRIMKKSVKDLKKNAISLIFKWLS